MMNWTKYLNIWNSNSLLLIIAIVFIHSSCKKDKVQDSDLIDKYIHISHTRSFNNDQMDSDIVKLPLVDYGLVLLGGDLMELTSEEIAVMEYVDDVFDIQNPNTLWTLGNHDYSDLGLISEFTGRNNFYSYHKDGITYMILDSQMDNSKILDEQLEFVDEILDTIAESSHLIILTHHLIWLDDKGHLSTIADSISNAPLSDCWYCINPNNFYEDIYPDLIRLEEKGIEVICIGGDIGFFVNSFEYLTEEGIDFLGSGISYSKQEKNKVLEFVHDLSSRTLIWEYKKVKDLIN